VPVVIGGFVQVIEAATSKSCFPDLPCAIRAAAKPGCNRSTTGVMAKPLIHDVGPAGKPITEHEALGEADLLAWPSRRCLTRPRGCPSVPLMAFPPGKTDLAGRELRN